MALFIKRESLVNLLTRINNTHVIFVDFTNELPSANREGVHYTNEDFDNKFKAIINSQNEIVKRKDLSAVYILFGVSKADKRLEDVSLLNKLSASVKASENTNIIFVDSGNMLKACEFEDWFSIRNNSSGIWVGRGVYDQNIFRINRVTKEMQAEIGNNYGYVVSEGETELTKLIEFNDMLEGDDILE